jgi:hypothetical protein
VSSLRDPMPARQLPERTGTRKAAG